MRTRNGFTLVELLAVMIILGLLIVLVIPAYSSVYSGIKRNNYQNKLIELSTAAKKYGSKIKDEIKYYSDTNDECYKLEPKVLIEKGYLMSDFENKPAFINPADQSEMTGDIRICYCKSTFDIEAYYVEDLQVSKDNKITKTYHEEDIIQYNKVLYRCVTTYNPNERENDNAPINKTRTLKVTSDSIKVGDTAYFVQVQC